MNPRPRIDPAGLALCLLACSAAGSLGAQRARALPSEPAHSASAADERHLPCIREPDPRGSDQGTALPPPAPTRIFEVRGQAWLPRVILAVPRVTPRPSPPPNRTNTAPPATTRPPATPAATTPAPATAVPSPSTPSATPMPVPPSATAVLCITEEREPNNAILEALDHPPLCLAQAVRGALPAGDETDYLRVEPAAPGLIVADLRAIPPGTNLDLYLYTRQGQLLAISQLPDTQPEHIEARVTLAGDYYLRVRPQSGRSTDFYEVTWSLLP